MVKVGDELLDELSNRCLKLMNYKVLIARTPSDEPFRQLYLGPLTITHLIDTDHLTVYMRHEVYNYTQDLVLAVCKHKHLFSRWPHVYEVLRILRVRMILDDLAAL